ncbi:hypothetical protein CKJ90_22255 [Klebsiella pneumoniae]|nr:hypothetical protein CKJ90_22255 [Klebsiella pneumoniae]
MINHGVDDALQYEVQRQSQRFFALDEAQKQQVAMIHSPHFRGYNRAALSTWPATRTPRIKRPSWPTCVMPPATSASSI